MNDRYSDLEKDFNDIVFKNDKSKSHPILWLLVLFFVVTMLYVWFFQETETFRSSIQQEVYFLQEAFGDNDAIIVLNRAQRWYQSMMVSSGIEYELNIRTVPAPKMDEKGSVDKTMLLLSDYSHQLIDNTKLVVYQALLRVSTLIQWALLLFVFTFAFLADSYYQYRIRSKQFSKLNIKSSALALRSFGVIFIVMYLYLIAPMLSSYVVKYGPLFLCSVIIASGSMLIRNYVRF
ncbi:DUF4400 domain-containing protein [Enterovibrio norvegicus]|uniref:DUF4400 domain-containing protein n=1 Tax=Enterovibrio norvegicus TaxID=188144 RepID=UPI00352C2331